jgi:NarL family two-component system response regulator LiaR
MTEKEDIRVMIVDDHDMVRLGLATYLKATPDLKLVGEASSGEQAVRLCEQLQPQVVLMDLVMPGLGGAAAISQIKARFPEIKIIALTSFQERDLVQTVLRAGAISYLLKNVTGEELATAIRSANSGRPTLAPEVTQEFVLNSQKPRPGDNLSDREREVLALVVEGLSNPEIAQRLTISRSTARAHVSNILTKLSVSNRAEAITLALRNKLVR